MSRSGPPAASTEDSVRDGSLRITAPGLEALRASIDRIDRATADLLVRRARMARRVALLKRLLNLPHRDPGREQEVRDHYATILRKAGWSEESLDNWLSTMLSASRDLQAQLSIAIQGATGSWSELSLHRVLPSVNILPCDTVADAWRQTRTGAADAAWLASHNSTIGDIEATSSARHEAETWLEVEQPIQHALIAPAGVRVGELDHIEAHPLAFEQCAASLARLVPRAQRVTAIDGAHAAAGLAQKRSTGVLASATVARTFGLSVLHERMNDAPDNRTTFQLLLSKEIF